MTLTEIRVMASEKQPGIWLDQKRSSLIRDFNHLSPAIQIGPKQGSGKREKNDHPLPGLIQATRLRQIVNPKPAVEPRPTRQLSEPVVEPEPVVGPESISFTEFSYLLPIINFGQDGDRIAEHDGSEPSQQSVGDSVTELNHRLRPRIGDTDGKHLPNVAARPDRRRPGELSGIQEKIPSQGPGTYHGPGSVPLPSLAAEPLEPNSRASGIGPENPKSRCKRRNTPPSGHKNYEEAPLPAPMPKPASSRLFSKLKNRLSPNPLRVDSAQESKPPPPVFKPPSTARSWSSAASQGLRKILPFKTKKEQPSTLEHSYESSSSSTLKAASKRSRHSENLGVDSTASNTPTGRFSITSSMSRSSSRTSCGKSYHTGLEAALTLQEKPRPFQCTFCLKQCENAEEWIQHEKSSHVHKNKSDWFWECGFCDTLLQSWDKRQEHIIDEHFNKGATMLSWNPLRSPSPMIKRFGTPAPGFPHWDKAALFALQKLTLSDSSNSQKSGREYRCKICDIEFANLSTYMGHTDLWHCSPESWSCPSLANEPPLDAFFCPTGPDSTGSARDECICCEQKFYTRPLNVSLEARIQHLKDVHCFHECAHEEKFFRKEYFHLHLANAHNINDFGSLLNFIDSRAREERAPASMV